MSQPLRHSPLRAIPALLALLLAPALPVRAQSPAQPATKAQYAQWRSQIRQALFIPKKLPALAPHQFGAFIPVEGVVAQRVTYATLYGMRVPAIVYRPTKSTGRLPGLVIVNGHGGDKTSWYAYYSGILYARAGAVVVTYDPLGEDERNITHASTNTHDTFIPGPQMPERLGGQMITDILQAVSYLAQRDDVDPARLAVLGFSMGSFHSAIAGAIDPRIHTLVLSGGGNLDGPGDYWDSSPKIMCQSGPYKSLSFLPDRGADLYALNQDRGATFIMNGTADKVVTSHNNLEPFFVTLRDRTAAVSGTRANLFETQWFPEAGHRPNFITRPGALWLEDQLHFPNWTAASLKALPEITIDEWNAKSSAATTPEGGLLAVDVGVPHLTRDLLQAVPTADWEQHKTDYIYDVWVERARAAAQSTPTPSH